MTLNEAFKDLIKELVISNIDDINKSIKGITKKLNKHYYDLDSETENILLVGSMGRKTSISGESDIDIIFNLPNETYRKYNNYESNGQSQLLQEVKNVIKEKYSSTDIKGDGQVVVINFTKYKIELVPGFYQSSGYYVGQYKYPDSNDGGSWKYSNPLPEIKKCDDMNQFYVFRDACKIIRAWKSNNGVTIGGLLIDTLVCNFFETYSDKYKNIIYSVDYVVLFKDILQYLSEQEEDRKQWYALGSNQVIYNNDYNFMNIAQDSFNQIDDCDNEEDLWDCFKELLGRKFPKEEDKSLSLYSAQNNERFIEDIVDSVKIKYNLEINCDITQDGFRPFDLLTFLLNPNPYRKLKANKKLQFYIVECNVPEPYEVYWKVRNRGLEAYKRDQLRGEITNNRVKSERTNFRGNHYVECYIVKNNTCVARKKIHVPIE